MEALVVLYYCIFEFSDFIVTVFYVFNQLVEVFEFLDRYIPAVISTLILRYKLSVSKIQCKKHAYTREQKKWAR